MEKDLDIEDLEDDILDGTEDVAPSQEADAQGLYEHYSFTVDRGQSMVRLDKFLSVHIEKCSRNRIQNAVDSGCIFVNGKAQKASYKVKPLDAISVRMPYPKYESLLEPEDIPIDILYEDDDVLVINKAAGMCVHPGHGNYEHTLVNAVAFHLRSLPMFQSGDERAGLVHRIDKNTSGILVMGKTAEACTSLASQFFCHSTQRRYVALVWGNFTEDDGTIEGNVGRNPNSRMQMCVFPNGEDGKHAVTHYHVLRRYGYVTLVECRLETGRTHQIRVHMQYIGHPLFNDERYGGDRILKGTTFSKYRQFVENCFEIMPRHALHARLLGFVHPTTGKEMVFETPLPDDFRQVLEKWDAYTASSVHQ